MALKTHQPSGLPPYPLILLEGQPKWGKSFTAYSLSASQRVHRTFVFDMGEGSAEGYARLGRYEVVDLDGTWRDFIDSVHEAIAQPGGPHGEPNVIVIDSITEVWNDLKSWVDYRAMNSKKGKQLLAVDPDAEVERGMHLWNPAKDRWNDMVESLRRWPGIGILIAQSDEKSAVDNDGRPILDRGRKVTTYKVDAEKTTERSVTCIVRFTAPRTPVLKGLWSLDVEVPADGLPLATENTLEDLCFRMLQPEGNGWSLPALHTTGGFEGREARKEIYRRLVAKPEDGGAGIAVEIAQPLPARVWQEMGWPSEQVVTPVAIAQLTQMALTLAAPLDVPADQGMAGEQYAPPVTTPAEPGAGEPQPDSGGDPGPQPPEGPETGTQREEPPPEVVPDEQPPDPAEEERQRLISELLPTLMSQDRNALMTQAQGFGLSVPARATKGDLSQMLAAAYAAEEMAPAPVEAPGGYVLPAETVAEITDGVQRLRPSDLQLVAKAAHLELGGTLQQIRDRVVEFRCREKAARLAEPAAG